METEDQSAKIIVVVECLHPRVVYALETVLGEFFGLDLQLIVWDNAEALAATENLPRFSYRPAPSLDCINLPCNGLLYEDVIRQANEQLDWFGPVSDQMRTVDLFAQIFYHLSQYELLRPAGRIQRDQHGRYPEGDGRLVVHELLAELRSLLLPYFPRLNIPRPFDFEITIDIDQPWKYLHKPLHVRWGGLIRDFFRGTSTKERLQTLKTGRDPFDVLATVQALFPLEKTRAFFLVGGDHPNDSRFDIGQKAFQDYVCAYKQAGIEIGVHPSYESMDHERLLHSQKAALEKIVGPVKISRQHFLRYRTPEAFRALIAAGIERDYTLCRSQGPGAVTGVAFPYRWFDLQRNHATSLVLVPAMVMDRSLQQYLGLTPTEALQEIERLIAQTRAVGGHFVIILHNETLSESGEWIGWLPVIREMLLRLQS